VAYYFIDAENDHSEVRRTPRGVFFLEDENL